MIRSTAPDAYVLFFPYTQEQTFLGERYSASFLNTHQLVAKSELISVSTNKPKGGVGTFRVILGSSFNYKARIHPGCWCMIYISDEQLDWRNPDRFNGDESGLKMLGIVRSIRCIEGVDPGSGTKSVRYEVTGDDFQSLLSNQLYINPILRPGGDEKSNPIIDSLALFRKTFNDPLKPDQMVKALTYAVLGRNASVDTVLHFKGSTVGGIYALPPGVALRLKDRSAKENKFVNALRFFTQKNLTGHLVPQPDLGNLINLWSMLEAFAHRVLNELYCDLFPVLEGKKVLLEPGLVLRAIPFSSSTGKIKLPSGKQRSYPTLSFKEFARPRAARDMNEGSGVQLYTSKKIGEDEIYSLNYGKSDGERFNFFLVTSTRANQYGLSAFVLDELLKKGQGITDLGKANDIFRNGFRPFIQTSDYTTIAEGDLLIINEVVRDLWTDAHLFENGTVTIVGSKFHIPVGTNIEFKDRGWVAHVENVSHDYVVSSEGVKTFRTTISFVRLQTLKGKPIDLVEDTKLQLPFDRGVTHSEMGSRKTKQDNPK